MKSCGRAGDAVGMTRPRIAAACSDQQIVLKRSIPQPCGTNRRKQASQIISAGSFVPLVTNSFELGLHPASCCPLVLPTTAYLQPTFANVAIGSERYPTLYMTQRRANHWFPMPAFTAAQALCFDVEWFAEFPTCFFLQDAPIVMQQHST